MGLLAGEVGSLGGGVGRGSASFLAGGVAGLSCRRCCRPFLMMILHMLMKLGVARKFGRAAPAGKDF